jgi:hypothetical protein
MKKDIYTFVYQCDTCQSNKGELIRPLGTLHPLPIPTYICTYISMYFIVGIPKVGNKLVIMVVVDRLSKYDHFSALPHQFTPTMVAQVLIHHTFKLHGIPTSVVSKRDPTFTNKFWQELFKLQVTQLNMSTSYHPHSRWEN